MVLVFPVTRVLSPRDLPTVTEPSSVKHESIARCVCLSAISIVSFTASTTVKPKNKPR